MAKVNVSAGSESRLRTIQYRRLCTRLLVAVLFSAAILATCFAQELHPTESQVEAAYLYNFGKFVTWPPDRAANPDFEICILGSDPFGGAIDSIVKGESIGRRKIRVRRISSTQEASTCSILYISSSEEARLAVILAAARPMNLLTVSDMKRFAERGGAIGLVPQEGRIRFEVNRSAAERSHLQLSSELLKIAVRVIESGPGS